MYDYGMYTVCSHLIFLLSYSTCPKDHVPEVKVLTTLGMFAVPVTAETTLGEIRQKVQDRVTAMGCKKRLEYINGRWLFLKGAGRVVQNTSFSTWY